MSDDEFTMWFLDYLANEQVNNNIKIAIYALKYVTKKGYIN